MPNWFPVMLIAPFALSWTLWGCGNADSAAEHAGTEETDEGGRRSSDSQKTGTDSSTDDRFWEGSQDISGDDDLLDAQAVALAAGAAHTCAVTDDKKLACWGRNTEKQAGCEESVCLPASLVDGPTRVRSVAAGSAHTCYVDEDGAAACFGSNPVAPPELEKGVASIHAGRAHTCAILETGEVLCFGKNTHGQTGQPGGRDADTKRPTLVEGLSGPAVDLALGYFHSCAIIEGGSVQCWGDSGDDLLGIPEEEVGERSVVDAVNLESGVVDIDAAQYHTCAVKDDGTLYCWGRCSFHTCGAGDIYREQVPTQVTDAPPDVAKVAASDYFTCVLTKSGEVHCVGEKDSVIQSERFEKIDGLPQNITAIDAGREHVCAVDEGGGVWCWGRIGSVGHTRLGLAYPLPGLDEGIRELSMTEESVCGRLADGFRCFYHPSSGKAYHKDDSSIAPTRLTQGDGFTCVLDPEGRPLCRGDNMWSQLGDIESTRKMNWVPVEGVPDTVADITSRGKGSLALGEDGRVYLIGHVDRKKDCGNYECPADDWLYPPTPPVEMTELGKDNKKVLNGNCVVTSSDTLTCIERDWSGAGHLKTPAFVDEDAKDISQGEDYYCWLRPNGAVRCAGEYEADICEKGEGEDSGCTIADLDPAIDVAVGTSHGCALRKDGQVKCWGSGWIGDGKSRTKHPPLIVQGLPGDIVEIEAFEGDSCALTSSGAVYCWGGRIFEDYDDVRCDWLGCYAQAPKPVLGF